MHFVSLAFEMRSMSRLHDRNSDHLEQPVIRVCDVLEEWRLILRRKSNTTISEDHCYVIACAYAIPDAVFAPLIETVTEIDLVIPQFASFQRWSESLFERYDRQLPLAAG